MRHGHRGQLWLVLFCADGYSGCPQAMAEWERAHASIGSYVRMGRVNVDSQWMLVRNFNVRYVPAVYLVQENGEEMSRYGGSITASSLSSYVRSSISNEFAELRTVDAWRNAFNWETRIHAGGLDQTEKVQVVLLTTDRNIPLKWRYWGKKFSQTINFFVVNPQTATSTLMTMLNTNYGVARSGVAMLFPNPRDNTDVVILSDDERDNDFEDESLSSEEVQAWLLNNQFPRTVKLDSFNFLHAVGSSHFTIVMAVDMSIGGTGASPSTFGSASGSHFAQSAAFGSSRLKRFGKMIEPMTTLWEQRRGNSQRELQFAWFSTHNLAMAHAFGIEKPVDGMLIVLDRRRWEFAVLPLDIDRDEVVSFVNILIKYSSKHLAMRPLVHIPQSTDGEWSLTDALWTASNWGYTAIGLGLVVLFGASMLWTGLGDTASAKKKEQAKEKPKKKESEKPKEKEAPSASSSTSSSSTSSSSSSNGTSSQSEPKPKPSTSSERPASSSTPQLFKVTLEHWTELTGLNYEAVLKKRNFTVVLFPRLDRMSEAKQWQGEVEVASDALATDSVTFAWADAHRQPKYVKYWTDWCDKYLSETQDGPDAGSQKTLGILLRKRGNRYMIFSTDSTGQRKLNSTTLISWVQRVLEGQTAWMDVPEGAPTPA